MNTILLHALLDMGIDIDEAIDLAKRASDETKEDK